MPSFAFPGMVRLLKKLEDVAIPPFAFDATLTPATEKTANCEKFKYCPGAFVMVIVLTPRNGVVDTEFKKFSFLFVVK
jgi:hypothetical protein